jgi:hypothetical protein
MNTVTTKILTGIAVMAGIAMAIILGGMYWTKPGCLGGHVPIFVITDGWNCVPGYKPLR